MSWFKRHGLIILAWGATLGNLSLVVCLVVYLLRRGSGSLQLSLFFGTTPWQDAVFYGRAVFDGIWPSVGGTLSLVAGASALAIPIGVLAGIHLAETPESRIKTWLRSAIDLLAAVPSIIMGLFGFGLILVLRQTLLPEANTSLLLAMVCLAFLVLPYLVRTTEAALLGLPPSLRLTGQALGMSRGQTLWQVHLPAARRGILGGVLLSIGRIAEDTAVILITGVVANSSGTGRLTGKFQALPFDIFYLAAEHRNQDDLQRAFATALVLLVLTSFFFIMARLLSRKMDLKEGRER